MRRRLALTVVVTLVTLVSVGCGGGGDERSGAITVLAAASLTGSFSEIGRRFEAVHPGARVTFGFDASSALVRQVANGAPADVVATADPATLDELVQAGKVDRPVVFAHNRLAIVVAKGNPRRLASLADLAGPGIVVVLCAAEVPCGRFGAEVLERAGVRVRPRSLEPNVKAVVAKVALGEADAGVVYASDVAGPGAGGGVEGVAIPSDQNVVTSYAAATASGSSRTTLASAFVAYLRSAEGMSALTAWGLAPA